MTTNAGTVTSTDAVNQETRWLSLVIIPILLLAIAILYLVPERTGQLFAWQIDSAMTAMTLGATYGGGVYYFYRAWRAPRWHWFGHGFLAIWCFVIVLGLSTLLHWERFNQSHPSFWLWAALYLTTPVIIPLIWWRNRKADPGLPDSQDTTLSQTARWTMGAFGLAGAAVSLLLFFAPTAMIDLWPWALTPLTARVTAAMFILPGIFGIVAALDKRWSAVRIMLEAQIVGIIMMLVAALRAWAEFDVTRKATWVFIGGLVLNLLILIVIHVTSQRAARQ